jgi:hypothetical protein
MNQRLDDYLIMTEQLILYRQGFNKDQSSRLKQ